MRDLLTNKRHVLKCHLMPKATNYNQRSVPHCAVESLTETRCGFSQTYEIYTHIPMESNTYIVCQWLFPEAMGGMLQACEEVCWSTSLQLCGNALWQHLNRAAPNVDRKTEPVFFPLSIEVSFKNCKFRLTLSVSILLFGRRVLNGSSTLNRSA
jgi:hypothetical protein